MTVLKQQGLEWHDGWVASILHFDDASTYAAIAVAIDWDHHRMRFALLPISAEQVDFLANHEAFSSEFKMVWQRVLSLLPVYLVDQEPCVGTSLRLTEADEAQRRRLKHYQLPLVEVASSEDAFRFWLPSAPPNDSPPTTPRG